MNENYWGDKFWNNICENTINARQRQDKVILIKTLLRAMYDKGTEELTVCFAKVDSHKIVTVTKEKLLQGIIE